MCQKDQFYLLVILKSVWWYFVAWRRFSHHVGQMFFLEHKRGLWGRELWQAGILMSSADCSSCLVVPLEDLGCDLSNQGDRNFFVQTLYVSILCFWPLLQWWLSQLGGKECELHLLLLKSMIRLHYNKTSTLQFSKYLEVLICKDI